jgi:hypothetical protein
MKTLMALAATTITAILLAATPASGYPPPPFGVGAQICKRQCAAKADRCYGGATDESAANACVADYQACLARCD